MTKPNLFEWLKGDQILTWIVFLVHAMWSSHYDVIWSPSKFLNVRAIISQSHRTPKISHVIIRNVRNRLEILKEIENTFNKEIDFLWGGNNCRTRFWVLSCTFWLHLILTEILTAFSISLQQLLSIFLTSFWLHFENIVSTRTFDKGNWFFALYLKVGRK